MSPRQRRAALSPGPGASKPARHGDAADAHDRPDLVIRSLDGTTQAAAGGGLGGRSNNLVSPHGLRSDSADQEPERPRDLTRHAEGAAKRCHRGAALLALWPNRPVTENEDRPGVAPSASLSDGGALASVALRVYFNAARVGVGTGFIVAHEGTSFLLTNYHVLVSVRPSAERLPY
jgi:hypothetical protein